MERIINLTQHPATPEQKEAGVLDLEGESLLMLQELLTFNDIPTEKELMLQSSQIALIAKSRLANKAMIGGAPFFMVFMHMALLREGITPVYAFSRRESIEEIQPDGTVKKLSIFKHIGFVE